MPSLTVVTPSRWLAGYARESYLGEYPVQVIPNGIALDKFHPVDQGLRRKLGFEGKYILLGVASMWEERKGYAYFEQLADRLPDDYQIILIGLSKRKMKQLHPKIHGVMRTNSMEELAEYYSMADVYVNTTLEDTFPTTNLEAGLRNPGYYLCHRRKRGVCGRKLRQGGSQGGYGSPGGGGEGHAVRAG